MTFNCSPFFELSTSPHPDIHSHPQCDLTSLFLSDLLSLHYIYLRVNTVISSFTQPASDFCISFFVCVFSPITSSFVKILSFKAYLQNHLLDKALPDIHLAILFFFKGIPLFLLYVYLFI